jgi:predicted amidohydrolase
VEEALSLVSGFAVEAAAGSADLLILPELALSGYGDIELTKNLALGLDQASARLGEIARTHGIGLLVGYSEKLGDGFANSAIMLDADGRQLLNYRKMHLWGDYEEEMFVPGARGEVVELRPGIKAGVLICFDLDHPVTAHDLTSRGADVILALSATSHPYDVVPMAQVPARAYENSVFVAFCNQAGSQNGFDFIGLSTVVAPDGSVLARAGRSAGEFVIAHLDLSSFDDYRRGHRYAEKLRRDIFPEPLDLSA